MEKTENKSVTAVNRGYLGGELLPWSRRNPAVNQPENDVGVTVAREQG
jgi:hypothetical protein